MFDILLRDARVFDGTGNPWHWADIGIVGDKIAAMGRLSESKGRYTIDVAGRAVAPGFIDAHVHLDTALLLEPAAEPLLAQGVTTAILGQDGLGFAPATPATLSYMSDYSAALNPHYEFETNDTMFSVDRYLSLFEGGVAINVGYLLPHGVIRYNVLGAAGREATPTELAHMRRQVREGMAEGALGLSTGLEYVPAMFADTNEITMLCREVAACEGIYVTHMRNYREKAEQSVAEVVSIAKKTGVRTHISHYNLPTQWGLGLIDTARQQGADITIESYPYLAGSTVLAYFLPGWLSEGGTEETLTRLADADVRAKLRLTVEDGLDWQQVQLSFVPSAANRDLEGLRVPEAARRRRRDLTDFVCDILLAERLCVGVIEFHTQRSEDDVVAMMHHPAQLFGSDGIYRGKAHPRGWGAFARVLARYVREQQALPLADAIRRMSAHPAARYGLWDRGLLKEGYAADLIVFDPCGIADQATYANSRCLAEGVDAVVVNGCLAWCDGHPTGAMAGRALRRGRRAAME